MKTKILYVDDEPINLMLFQINFESTYEVFTANNAFEGLEFLDKEPEILVIISDMKMPGMNGIEFIKRAKEKYPDKKFYILTGYEMTEEIKEALETGLILNYFSKPFRLQEIESAIIDAIN